MKRILVVDDEHGTNTLAAEYLRLEGLEVSARFDAETAWTALLEETFVVAVIDRRLPDLDGLELCARLKRDPRTAGVKVLLISAVGRAAAPGAVEGPDGFLAKPFRPKDLAAEVRRLIGEAGA